MAAKRRRKKKQAVPAMMLVVLALALIAVGAAIWLLIRLTNEQAAPKKPQPIAEQTQTVSTEKTTYTTSFTTITTESISTPAEATSLTSTSLTSESSTAASTTASLPPGTVTGISLTFYSASMNVGDSKIMPIVTMSPANAVNKAEIWQSSNKAVATVDTLGNITPVGAGECIITVTSASNPAVFAEVKITVNNPGASTSAPGGTTAPHRSDIEVINGVTYVQGILIANKTYPLPSTYNPGLDSVALAAFNEMAAAAKQDGLSLAIVSGFRSYDTQNTLYNNYCARDGKAAADRFSARPGHSEHQTGLGMDINWAGDSFRNTPEAKWLAENCWKYGFIIRYPEGKEAITGYKYEPWHVRYLGKDWSKKVFDSGLTLEEYLNIDSKYAN